MPAPPPNVPSYLERADLDAIRGDPRYHASAATILKFLRKGWIEQRVGKGLKKYAITVAGAEALKAKMRTY